MNAISRFTAGGIIPLDRSQVLKRMPDLMTEYRKEVWSIKFKETLRSRPITTKALADEAEEPMNVDDLQSQELLLVSDKENVEESNEIESETKLIEQVTNPYPTSRPIK
ncbi:hypothetical protein QE152_g31345 [Popillia japonica]|uniref:Uncharacterized protein n=1 Tax=Popillia japonica TaxID=7064 RepID=A0AAW1J2E3_POPJA